MTREEAIKILRREIECLSHTKCEDCILEAGCNPIKTTPYDSEYIEVYEMAIKALEQEPCEDEYIKVPKKALKYRTAGMVAYNAEWLKNHFDIERAVICGAQQPCEDCISRQASIEAFQMFREYESNRTHKDWVDLIETVLNQLPPVTPQPKTGHWINTANPCMSDNIVCSECGYDSIADYKFCPNCGAKMVESQESEDT